MNRFNKINTKFTHKSYIYVLGFCLSFMLSIVFIENLANKNEGKNFSSSEKSRFNQTQSNNFIKKIDSKKMAVLPVKNKEYISVSEKKKRFINSLLPIVKDTNLEILEKRNVLFHIDKKIKNNNLNVLEAKVLKKMFREYKIKNNDISELKKRLDIVPISMAIAQAAIESGWGTSRFALEGNALFGQWTWSGEGIKPAGADNDATHKIMKFKILKSSVRAYQRNLNTHSSYKQFRLARAELRDNKMKLDSLILSNYLDKYAETGDEYVKILKQIIKQNNLTELDDAKLLPSSKKLKSLI